MSLGLRGAAGGPAAGAEERVGVKVFFRANSAGVHFGAAGLGAVFPDGFGPNLFS